MSSVCLLVYVMNTFKVNPITNFSDPCHLSLELDMEIKKNNTKSKSNNKNFLRKMKLSYISSEESKYDILEYFDDRLLDKVFNDLNKIPNAEEKLTTISDLLVVACDKCIKKQTGRPNNN